MKRIKLEELTVDELVDRFAELGIFQAQAELYGEISKYNRLFKEMTTVGQELRIRGREARLAVQRLYDHPNMQVRLQAAIETLAVAPEAARQVIEDISKSACFPQAGDAGMALWRLDTGAFKPE
jgi:Domain of unknown function (DUF2019)